MIVDELARNWADSGIKIGDVVLIHSSLRSTLKHYLKQGIEITPELILESLLTAVGQEGTLLLPLFNFDFPKGVPFDMRSSPSQMGALTESGRKHRDAVRTGHPIYSFAAIGAQSNRFHVDNYSGYGADSPFGVLRELDGKIAVLDLPDQDSITFYHHVEEMNSVPYRYHKQFTGNYTDMQGNTNTKTYGLFVRDVENHVLTHVNRAGELMWNAGLFTGFRPGEGNRLRVISARAMFDFVSEIIHSGRARGLLYIVEGDET